MKKILSICLCLCLLLGISGCGGEESKEVSYDEAEIVKKGEEIINDMNAQDYQAVIDKGDDNLKKSLTSDQLKAGMDQYVLPLGAFKENEQHEVTTKDGSIVAGFISAYEKGKIQYIISFDESGAMNGIHLSPVS